VSEFLLCCQSSDIVSVTSNEILPAVLCLWCDDYNRYLNLCRKSLGRQFLVQH
jgi:hypothetical protein